MKISTVPNHGTIFYTTGGHKASAVFLSDGIVITSALLLTDNVSVAKRITDAVKKTPIVELCKIDQVNRLDFRIVRKHQNQLEERTARALYIVHSPRVKACLEQVLSGLQIVLNGDTKMLHEFGSLYSSFIVLSANGSEVSPWHSIQSLLNCASHASDEPLKLLDKVVTVSTPFGNESFFNTVHIGHVCNVFGDNDCMLLLDVPLSMGCEGGAVYDSKMKLRGFLIGSTFMYRNDNVTLSLVVNVDELLNISHNERNLCNRLPSSFPEQAFRSVCMIDSQGCWGTGCAFELKGNHYIISCAHVLATDNITCFFNDRQVMHPKVLFKNPTFDSAYDIALMEASYEEAQSVNWFCRLANYIPRVGQRLYAVGFPVLKSLAMKPTFRPSIVPGRVTKYTDGILFTDCSIQNGQSGGPVFDENGLLIAIVVSNFKSSLDNRMYPFHNMCVPICAIYPALEQYTETRDKSSLDALQADWSIRSKWKLKPPPILNKL
ncbi:peroxisomal leader peptide-processing protease [Anopheles cruzii]|uniref:peroxisomal leader peptide-processing protease n=1 Tax=Anopheles cruzii TaxID=68878 RepID=UPI0022EC1D4E|nr:peroxisomal leader peptide-processing protease [Anopheles cruzii]